MREHPAISDHVLAGADLHPLVRQIVRSHHERIDGDGYPDGLAGDEIPLPARILHVANAFDFLTNDVPYKKAGSVEAALEEIRAHAGSQFCTLVVEALEHMYAEKQRATPCCPRAGGAADFC